MIEAEQSKGFSVTSIHRIVSVDDNWNINLSLATDRIAITNIDNILSRMLSHLRNEEWKSQILI